MAKFPTEVEKSVTVKASLDKVHKYLWDVVGSSKCIPGLASCKKVGTDKFRFEYEERSAAGLTMKVCYTAQYESDGKSRIAFSNAPGKSDNTDVDGELRLQKSGDGTRITLRQTLAPDTPVPALLQRLVRSFVDKEAADAAGEYLANLKRNLEGVKKG
jgi:carbon monoxide dehydrogenase subunit G